jgi:hypothetical protein
VFNSILINAQDSYKEKNYDEKIFLYQMSCVEKNDIKKDDYLYYTKALSKWDTRPINLSTVWIMEEIQPSSVVPNFFWGSFARYYNVEINDAMELANIFLEKAKNNNMEYINDFSSKKEDYEELISQILKTDKRIFLSQKNLRRVDNLFYENENYWSYLIPGDSPYPMSDSITTVTDLNYTESETNILETMEKLELYAVYNDADAIYLLIDGMLDNSFGYIFTKQPDKLSSNHLFEVNHKIQMETNFYFYVAN